MKARVHADSARGLAECPIEFTFSLEKRDGRVTAKVLAAYVTLMGREGAVADTIACDDAAATVDLNASGEVVGIELLSGVGPYSLKELGKLVRKSKDRLFVAAANVVVQSWPRVEVLTNVALEAVRALRKNDRRARDEAIDDEWTEQFRQELARRFDTSFAA